MIDGLSYEIEGGGGVLGWAFISAEGRAIGWWVPEGLCRSKWSSFGCIRVKVCLGVGVSRGCVVAPNWFYRSSTKYPPSILLGMLVPGNVS